MKQRSLFVFCLILGSSAFVLGQARTVTNNDLERYKRERLRGEQEYRDNYVRLGLPSPEELERRREKSRLESEQLSAKLRSERLERERTEAERAAAIELASAYRRAYSQPLIIADDDFYDSGSTFIGLGYGFGRPRFPNPRVFRQPGQTGYYAGGQFWPTGPRTSPRPMVRTPRR